MGASALDRPQFHCFDITPIMSFRRVSLETSKSSKNVKIPTDFYRKISKPSSQSEFLAEGEWLAELGPMFYALKERPAAPAREGGGAVRQAGSSKAGAVGGAGVGVGAGRTGGQLKSERRAAAELHQQRVDAAADAAADAEAASSRGSQSTRSASATVSVSAFASASASASASTRGFASPSQSRKPFESARSSSSAEFRSTGAGAGARVGVGAKPGASASEGRLSSWSTRIVDSTATCRGTGPVSERAGNGDVDGDAQSERGEHEHESSSSSITGGPGSSDHGPTKTSAGPSSGTQQTTATGHTAGDSDSDSTPRSSRRAFTPIIRPPPP